MSAVYANLSGRSGVAGYDLYPDGISVHFKSGQTYTYSDLSAGTQMVAQIKALAVGGLGLNRFLTANKPGTGTITSGQARDRFGRYANYNFVGPHKGLTPRKPR